jgi:hypothetical protein
MLTYLILSLYMYGVGTDTARYPRYRRHCSGHRRTHPSTVATPHSARKALKAVQVSNSMWSSSCVERWNESAYHAPMSKDAPEPKITRRRAPKSGERGSLLPKASMIPVSARKVLYDSFRAHTDEVRDVLLSILRNDEADNGHRIQAGKEILNRGWGQAPSIEIIEAAFKHEHTFNADALRQLPPKQLEQLEAMLAALIQVPGDQALDVTPNESAEHAPSGRIPAR